MAAKKPKTNPEDELLRDLRRDFTRAQNMCEESRKERELDQDYYDGKQWTQGEIETLKARNQPAIAFNETQAAVDGTIGLVERGRTDPKAWGRTPKDQDAAEVVTDCLRYALDTAQFNSTRSQGLKDYFIPGVVCAVVEIDPDTRDIVVRKGRAEEFFYDPYSRSPDFSDARFLGLAKWMDEADALALSDDERVQNAIRAAVDANGLLQSQTHDDRPYGWSWADKKARRVMVVEMYRRTGKSWRRVTFVSGAIISDEEAPYKDDKGRPICNLIAQSCYVDRELRRYGLVRNKRGPQDAINKAWSKATHIINVAKLRVSRNVGDVDEVRREWARPDGIIQGNKDEVEELGDRQLFPAHVEMMRDAQSFLRRTAPTPALVGRQSSGQSGRALLAEQQAGMTEMAQILAQFDDWTLRIYRATWYCIKQFWDAPKYIRVTDDEMAPKYVLMNARDPQTGLPFIDQQTGQPMPPNMVAEMDVDIIIDSTPDTAAIQEEQYQKLLELAQIAVQSGAVQDVNVLFEALVEASSLPRKKMFLEKLRPKEKSPQQQIAEELQMRGAVADVSEKEAGAQLKQAQAVKTQQEAQMVGVEPQIRMAEHQGEMQMQREEFGQQMAMKREEHGMKMEQQAQAGQLKAAQGVQAMQIRERQAAQQKQQGASRR